nr:hypothetical protein [Paracoccus saliphilus]
MTDDTTPEYEALSPQATGEPSSQQQARARMMNELERAALQERRLLDGDAGLFAPDELAEAEALLAEVDQLVARAEALNRTIGQRLRTEAVGNPEKAALLKRFRAAKGLTVKLAAF